MPRNPKNKIKICGQRKGGTIIPFSDYDKKELYKFPENQFLEVTATGSMKERAYRELCCYFGSCSYIAYLEINVNMNTKNKVDHLTKLKCGFVEDTVFDEKGLLHWITRSLSYNNCDQPESHNFIKKALEEHAELAGISDVDEYVKFLKGDNHAKND